MARRGEANFVAVRIGFWNDPHIQVMAQQLRVSLNEAGGYVLRWEELVLAVGDAQTGRVKGYTPQYLALAVGWKGRPEKLIEGLKTVGVLASHRGTFTHPFWAETRTGEYAIRRALEADRVAKWRRGEGPAPGEAGVQSADGTGSVRVQNADGTSNSGIKEGREYAYAHPPAPPQEGGGVGLTRWEWLLENHDRPRNKGACVKYLEAMPEDEWSLVQFAVTLRKKPGGANIGRRKRAWLLTSDDFLRKGAYLEFRREWQEKLRGPKAPANGKQPEVVDLISNSDKFILAQLADPELSDAEKERIRSGWKAKHPNEAPPWEVA